MINSRHDAIFYLMCKPETIGATMKLACKEADAKRLDFQAD